MIARRILVLAFVTFALGACGGGGGGGGGSSGGGGPTGNSPPPASPTAEDLSKAQNARLRMMLISPTLLDITWLDTFDNEQSYKIERRVGGGAWEVLETLPAIDGGSGYWQRGIENGSGTYRVTATFRDFSLPLHAAPGESEVSIDVSGPPLEVLTEAQPNGGLRVSVRNAGPAQSVTYSMASYQSNLARIAHVTGGEDFSTILPPERVLSDPSYTLITHVQKSTALSIRHSIAPVLATHTRPALLLHVGPAPTSDALLLSVRTTSLPGIAWVEFFANDQLLQRLDTPDRSNNWNHTIDPASLPSGVNTFRAVATDGNGETVSMDVEFSIDTVPALSVEAPFDGMIASGDRLSFRGTFGENIPGAVLTIDMGYRNTVFRTRTSPFTFDYSIAGQRGERLFTVRAESPTGQVNTRTYFVVLPSTARSYELIATDADQFLAADRGTLLYRKHSGAVVLRNAAGVETPLQLPEGLSFSHWWLSDGRVVAQERINRHVHVLTGSGQSIDLTPPLGSIGSLVPPVVRGDWVAFTPGGMEFAVYNLTTGERVDISVPASNLYLQFDIDTTPGNERLLFPATIDGTSGIYSHSLTAHTTDLLLGGAIQGVLTDGTRLALRYESGSAATAPLNNPTASTPLGSAGWDLVLRDGLILFYPAPRTVALDDGSSTVTLADIGSFDVNAIADGHVLFTDETQVHSWNSTSGKHHLLDAPVPAIHTQGVAYFLTGRTGALYRTSLP